MVKTETVMPLVDEAALYQQMVDNAREATDARWVEYCRYHPEQGLSEPVAWSSMDLPWMRAADQANRAVIPSYEGTTMMVDVHTNPMLEAVYLRGEQTDSTLFEAASGVNPDPQLTENAYLLAQLHYLSQWPVQIHGSVVGALIFYTAEPLSDRQRIICEAFVRQVVLTLENAALATTVSQQMEAIRVSRQRLVSSEERVRRQVGSYLHGHVQNHLLLIWYRLGELYQAMEAFPEGLRRQVKELQEAVEEVREHEIRQASHRLHPGLLQVGLLPALQELLAENKGAIQVHLEADEAVRAIDDVKGTGFSPSLRLTVYRVVEEAYNNVLLHAQAHTMKVRLQKASAGLAVQIQDDGCGFDPQETAWGLGLYSIDDLVDNAGGSWSVESSPGRGTAIDVQLPLL